MITRRSLFGLLTGIPLAAKLQARQPVVILETNVAGYRFYTGRVIEDRLGVGEAVVLRRERTNPYDSRAIEILHRSGVKLGYLPRQVNEIPSRMLDQGIALRATIGSIRPSSPAWRRIAVQVTMAFADGN